MLRIKVFAHTHKDRIEVLFFLFHETLWNFRAAQSSGEDSRSSHRGLEVVHHQSLAG